MTDVMKPLLDEIEAALARLTWARSVHEVPRHDERIVVYHGTDLAGRRWRLFVCHSEITDPQAPIVVMATATSAALLTIIKLPRELALKALATAQKAVLS